MGATTVQCALSPYGVKLTSYDGTGHVVVYLVAGQDILRCTDGLALFVEPCDRNLRAVGNREDQVLPSRFDGRRARGGCGEDRDTTKHRAGECERERAGYLHGEGGRRGHADGTFL